MIDFSEFTHPLDAKAMSAMKSVPGFETVADAFLKFYDEKLLHSLNMATRVRMGHDQLPQYYALLQEVCGDLEMPVPEMFLENGRCSAYSLGDKRPFVVAQSGLLSNLSKEEVKATLAGLCAHIACGHNRYITMAFIMMHSGASALGMAAALVKPVYWAVQAWHRCSCFTADRIESYVMGTPDFTFSRLLKMKGGSIYNNGEEKLNLEAYMRQVDEYQEELTFSKVQSWVQRCYLLGASNPFPVLRCMELRKWWALHGAEMARSAPKARRELTW